MDRILLKALYVVLLSIGLALVFNFLFFAKIVGVSVFLFTGILVGTVYWFGLQEKLSWQKSWWLVLLVLFFSLMPAIRANEFLNFLNILTAFGLLMILAYQIVGTPAILMKLRDYFILAVFVPFRMLGRAFSTVSLVSQIHSSVKHRDVWLRVFKGIVMAVPILVIFGLLFSEADLAFSQFLRGFIDINPSERFLQHTALLVFTFIAGLSYLSYIFFPKQVQPTVPPEQPSPIASGRGIEVLVFLGLIATLFIVFIGFQITYLFGGDTNIVNAGFTYAEYARRGFWELLIVASMSLLLLLAAEKYSGAETRKDKKFLIPALVLVAEVVIVIVSAFKRLSLYVDAYGMTSLRFYVAAFIVLLLALFVLLAVKFIKSKPEHFFTFGTLLTGAVFLLAMNLVNPDAYIIKANIEQLERTGKIDVLYVTDLSADAEAGKIELYKKLEGPDKETMRGILQEERGNLRRYNEHWQSGNLSRARGLKLLNQVGE